MCRAVPGRLVYEQHNKDSILYRWERTYRVFTEGGRRGEGYSCMHLRVVPVPWRDSWPHNHIQSTVLVTFCWQEAHTCILVHVSVKAGVSHTLNGRYTAALWIWELMWSKYTMQVYPTIVCSCRWSAPFHYLELTLLISTETKSMVDSLPASSTPRFHWLPFILQDIKYKKLYEAENRAGLEVTPFGIYIYVAILDRNRILLHCTYFKRITEFDAL